MAEYDFEVSIIRGCVCVTFPILDSRMGMGFNIHFSINFRLDKDRLLKISSICLFSIGISALKFLYNFSNKRKGTN